MPMISRSLAAAAFALVPATATAETPAGFALELNKLEAAGADCLATMVTANGTAERLTSFKLDLVVFGRDGVVAKRIAAELGPLAPTKTVVKAFPITGLACTAIDRLLVNEAVACTTADGPIEACVERIAVSSRAEAGLVK